MTPQFDNPDVAEVFAGYPSDVRKELLKLRKMILNTAAKTEGVGQIAETLRWGQPSYLTSKPKSGSTIRLGPIDEDSFALFFHCQTTLVEQFRASYGSQLRYDGNRAVVWNVRDKLPKKTVEECIKAALLYHTRKQRG